MTVQPIVYRGRRVAVATQTSYLLSTELEARPRDDPERLFVQFMCLHAADVLSGAASGPYSDERAREYARACLVPPGVVDGDVELAARELRVSAAEIAVRRRPAAA
jgi:hypothetical protein